MGSRKWEVGSSTPRRRSAHRTTSLHSYTPTYYTPTYLVRPRTPYTPTRSRTYYRAQALNWAQHKSRQDCVELLERPTAEAEAKAKTIGGVEREVLAHGSLTPTPTPNPNPNPFPDPDPSPDPNPDPSPNPSPDPVPFP